MMGQSEKLHPAEAIYAWLLILNGAVGFAMMCILGVKMGFGATYLGFPLALFGLASGALSLKGKSAGYVAGAAFYLIQCVRYYSPSWNFGFTSGFQAGFSFPLSDSETIVFNIAAMSGVVYGVALLIWKLTKDDSVTA